MGSFRPRDAQVALLAEGAVEAAEGALVFLGREGGDRRGASRGCCRARTIGAGNEPVEDEAVGDPVDADRLVRGGLRDRQDVV